jgi:hypothetical protein
MQRTRTTPRVEYNGARNDAEGQLRFIDDKINHFALSLDCTPSFTEVTTNDTAIMDSGAPEIFISRCDVQRQTSSARPAQRKHA